jgi:hypothetical protein
MFRKTISHVVATLITAAVIASGFAVYPAAANDLHQAAQAFGITSCSGSAPCIGGSNTGSGPGVQATGTSGVGLTASSKKNNGVRGDTHFNSFGQQTGVSGVAGFDDSTSGIGDNGVFGSSTNGTGVRGASSTGDGVVGSTGGGVTTAGVYGNDASTIGENGVIGNSTAGVGVNGTSINSYGVQGYSQNSIAVSGLSQGSDGVFGTSINGPGVEASSSNNVAIDAVSGSSNGEQTIQAIGGTSAASGYSLATFNSSLSPTLVMDNAGNLHISGLLFTGGPCSSGCAKTHDGMTGRVERYAPQEAAPTMEDVGEGQLSEGQSFVRLDPAFANVIDTRAGYVVFVTPEGPSRGLYVASRSAGGFVVVENPGGRSSVQFSYRIVAKPLGAAAARLPYVRADQLLHAVRSYTMPQKPRRTS